MLKSFKAYPTLLRAYWQLALEYRVQIIMWTLAGTYPLVMMAVWLNLAQGGEIGGFGPSQFVGYYLGVVWIRRITYIWILDDIEDRVRTGELSAYLLRPLDMVHMVFTQIVSVRFFNAVLVGAIIGVILLLIPGQQWVVTPANILAFCLVIPIGFLFEFFLQYTVDTVAFWVVEVESFGEIAFALLEIGRYPAAALPEPLRVIMTFIIPIAFVTTVPAEVIIGRVTPQFVFYGWVFAIAAFIACVWFWNFAVRRYCGASSWGGQSC